MRRARLDGVRGPRETFVEGERRSAYVTRPDRKAMTLPSSGNSLPTALEKLRDEGTLAFESDQGLRSVGFSGPNRERTISTWRAALSRDRAAGRQSASRARRCDRRRADGRGRSRRVRTRSQRSTPRGWSRNSQGHSADRGHTLAACRRASHARLMRAASRLRNGSAGETRPCARGRSRDLRPMRLHLHGAQIAIGCVRATPVLLLLPHILRRHSTNWKKHAIAPAHRGKWWLECQAGTDEGLCS